MQHTDCLLRFGTQVDAGLGVGGVIGVIPHDLMPKEMSGAAIGDLRAVDTMHQRKVPRLTQTVPHPGKCPERCSKPHVHIQQLSADMF